MASGNEYYDRETLYAQVWTEPVYKVAERYGVTDKAIAKAETAVCVLRIGKHAIIDRLVGRLVRCYNAGEREAGLRSMLLHALHVDATGEVRKESALIKRIDAVRRTGRCQTGVFLLHHKLHDVGAAARKQTARCVAILHVFAQIILDATGRVRM